MSNLYLHYKQLLSEASAAEAAQIIESAHNDCQLERLTVTEYGKIYFAAVPIINGAAAVTQKQRCSVLDPGAAAEKL